MLIESFELNPYGSGSRFLTPERDPIKTQKNINKKTVTFYDGKDIIFQYFYRDQNRFVSAAKFRITPDLIRVRYRIGLVLTAPNTPGNSRTTRRLQEKLVYHLFSNRLQQYFHTMQPLPD